MTNPGKALAEYLGISGNAIAANLTTAQKISAFYQGIRIISQDIGSLPLGFFARTGGTTIPLENEVTARFKYELDPNSRMTRYKFFEATIKHMAMRGNSYAIIHPGARRFEFVHSSLVTPMQDKITMEMFYRIQGRIGSLSNGLFTSNEILHFKGPGDSPFVGESVIKHAAKSLGVGLSQQELQSKFFENGSLIRDYFSTENALSDKAYARLKEDLTERKGVSGSSETRILEEGMKYAVVSMKAEDIGLIEGQKMTVVDVARWLNIPPDKLFDWTKVSYASMEQSSANYALQTIAPLCTNLEQEIAIKTLNYKKGEFARFNLEALIRADAIAKADSLVKLVTGGIFERNEARGLYDRNAKEGADELLFPLNAVPQSLVEAYYKAKIEAMTKGGIPPNDK